MINLFFRYAQSPLHRWWIETALACRAMLFAGSKYKCPCCGWRLRAFTHGGTSLKTRHHGYCPRCNSKARHRRNWLYLHERTNLFTHPLRLLHVSPKYALSRRLTRMQNVEFIGVDLEPRPNISMTVDITDIPLEANSIDAVICIHVLEHIENDRRAIAELYRVLKPGGWALISVPVRLDQPTYEDSSITTPEDRKRLFGEEQHVRMYGYDIVDRLEQSGFAVELDRGQDIDPGTLKKYGLLTNENVFYCTKA